MALLPLLITLLFIIFCASSPFVRAAQLISVLSHGAMPDGKTDSTKAFAAAWSQACASTQPATISVPKGSFSLGQVRFQGPCKNNAILLRIDGTLVAPSDYGVIGSAQNWLIFEHVTGVTISGGTLDGQGSGLWSCKSSGKDCPSGATSLEFSNSNNIAINGLASLNSQMFHIVINACQNVEVQGVKVSAAGDSPNTDGIHVQASTGVTILNSRIGTGDDCVSIGPGTSNLWIENVGCGPGHGISIGSLGKDSQEAGVQNVTVKTTTFTGTENGVRIKTWGRPSNGFARNILFQHAVMTDVQNPIVIDQNYCPGEKDCPGQVSGVKISDVTYQDIHGSSATELAVKFDCSKTNPCSGIKLEDVKLTYKNQPAEASCSNAGGVASGLCSTIQCPELWGKTRWENGLNQSLSCCLDTGLYFLRNVQFNGPCKNNAIVVRIDGSLLAPTDYRVIGNAASWISFLHVDGVSVSGGILDGHGSGFWSCKQSGKNCPSGATTLSLSNSKNIVISGLHSLNSQMFHIVVNGCRNVRIQGVKITASGNSPNTDGIHVQLSSGVKILNSKIGTGDDCVSVGAGTTNLWIENVVCGPGHGISIGSLGKDLKEPGVQNVTVKTVTFIGTQNGLRIKTWGRPSNGFVRNVLFQHAIMNNVQNPIVIDQNYCPDNKNCPGQASGVKISGVTYRDIHGTSATKVAVKFDCSKRSPCTGIRMENVRLTYNNQPASASCNNADGTASGFIQPSSCL
ncbi:hypothetical protein SADUNF_Sadunf07G0122700 [Salix dunnii]|uniref:Polygalacturonase n=1 Tax=Salix dunnii TaxID=1413687 RepID=A0A835K249_9ROSI|nr:hypothetical protein SADUNF_Sadunf07G0122700 [Salix dunnii]